MPSLLPDEDTFHERDDGDDDEPVDLLERISLFCLRRRTLPTHARDVLWIGRYALIDKHSEGAMGVVCRAIDPDFPERPIALKIPKSVLSARLRARIREEGRLLARVRHTHVLTMYEVGECDGTLFIAAEFLEGPTLRAWQAARERTWREVVELYLQIGDALAEIHRKGIVHQDIKPENMKLDADGRVRVLDFGLAHLESRLLEETAPGHGASPGATFYPGGTRGYMAPEQYLTAPIDARADQFSFCVCLWEALHGALPYTGEAVASTVLGRARRPLGAPVIATRRGPAWLRKILLRGLSEAREDRYPSMDALVGALRRRLARRWWPMAAVAAAAASAGVGMSLLLAPPPAEDALCRDPNAFLVGVVDDARLAALADRVGADTPGWSQVERRLQRSHAAWVAASASACADLRGEDWSGAAQCLMRERAELQAITDALQAEPTRVGHLAQDEVWLAAAASPASCADPGRVHMRVEPPVIADLPRLLALEADLATGAAAAAMRDTTTATAALMRARGAAVGLGDRAREGRAQLGLGELALQRGAFDAALAALREATRLAASSGDQPLALAAWTRLVSTYTRVGEPDVALELFAYADAELRRAGLGGTFAAAQLELAAAEAAFGADQGARAVALLEQAAATRERATTDPQEVQAVLLEGRESMLRGLIADHRDDNDAAMAHYTVAERMVRTALGPLHPERVHLLRMLGNSQILGRQLSAAEATLREARALAEEILDPTSTEHALIRVTEANLAVERGHWEEASRRIQEARASLDPTRGAPVVEAAIKLAALQGAVEVRLGDARTVETAFTRGMQLVRRFGVRGSELRRRAAVIAAGLGQIRSEQGRLLEAAALAVEAIDYADRCTPDECTYIFGTSAMIALKAGDTIKATRYAEHALGFVGPASHEEAAEIRQILGDARRVARRPRPEP